MAHGFLRGDTLAYAYRHSRINPRLPVVPRFSSGIVERAKRERA